VIPAVETILELDQKSIYRGRLGELDVLLRRALKKTPRPDEAPFEVPVFFGETTDPAFEDLAERTFDLFRCPLLKLAVEKDGRWRIEAIETLSPRDVPVELDTLFRKSLENYTRRRWVKPRASRATPRYDLAILHDPNDPLPPSSAKTLAKFQRVGEQMGIDVELIERRDLLKLTQFDALFIRETTSIPHHTFRFAKRAEAEGMPVIDDPTSILRCTNKVYLAELLKANNLAAPRTVIVGRSGLKDLESEIAFPVVLKIPDGAFSKGVKKAHDARELMEIGAAMLKESEIILAQEFMPTEFDWRVGVLAGEPIFVCQYFMSKKHWQIVKHSEGGGFSEGASRTLPVEEAPANVVRLGVQAARLIGNGLYGVDIKENERGAFVIEVNDNPNIDMGVEDAVLKDELYRRVLGEFVRRLDAKRGRY
jgi:glutathione synthase/RimK-type ligase-like ATP-grasp enzyme